MRTSRCIGSLDSRPLTFFSRTQPLALGSGPMYRTSSFATLTRTSGLQSRRLLPMRAIMDKVKSGKNRNAPPDREAPKNSPKSSTSARESVKAPNKEDLTGADQGDGEYQVPEMTREEFAARRKAFPDLFRFLDSFDVGGTPTREQEMQMQRQEETKVKSRLTRFADALAEEDEEERWDESVRFDAPLVETPPPQQLQQEQENLDMSSEERDALSHLNDFARRVHSMGEDVDEEDPMVLLFRKLDKEHELMRMQHEHVQNMPEYIGYNEEFDVEEARIRKEWMEDPRSVTAEHAQELYKKIEDMRQGLWEKYTEQGANRFLAENFDEFMRNELHKGDDDEEELSEEEQKMRLLRSPLARLLDPTSRK